MIRPLTALALAAALAVPADAQTLRQRQEQRAEDLRLAETLAGAVSACETEITAEIDWPSFRAEDYEANVSISGYCGHPLDAMRWMCTEDDGGLAKEAIQSGVSAYVCTRADERSISLEDGLLRFGVTFDSAGDWDFAKDFLLDNL